MMSGIGACLGACGAIPIAGCCCPNPYKKVEQGFTGLISEYGRYTRDAQPGIVYVGMRLAHAIMSLLTILSSE